MTSGRVDPEHAADLVLAPFLAEAERDPETLGLILTGSRGAGCADTESDYDLYWVLSDDAYAGRKKRGEPLKLQHGLAYGRVLVDVSYKCSRELARIAAQPSWRTYAYVASHVLVDKMGAVARALEAIATIPEEKARHDAAGWFDAYLNAFYRSMRAWRRGNELGARLHGANSIEYLVKTLFFLERRWPPYHDRLDRQLETLADQGWPPGFLHNVLIEVLRTGDPARQQALEARVEALLRARGFGHVLDAWGLDIERVKAWRFA